MRMRKMQIPMGTKNRNNTNHMRKPRMPHTILEPSPKKTKNKKENLINQNTFNILKIILINMHIISKTP